MLGRPMVSMTTPVLGKACLTSLTIRDLKVDKNMGLCHPMTREHNYLVMKGLVQTDPGASPLRTLSKVYLGKGLKTSNASDQMTECSRECLMMELDMIRIAVGLSPAEGWVLMGRDFLEIPLD